MVKIQSVDMMHNSIILRKYVIMMRPGTQRRKKPTSNYTIILELRIISIEKAIDRDSISNCRFKISNIGYT